VTDNIRDGVVVLHHFLMMTAALVRKSTLNRKTHQHVDLLKLSFSFAQIKEMWEINQELHIAEIFLKAPKGMVFCFR
jgi:hypothetical protein